MKQFNIQQLVKRDGKWQWVDTGVSFNDDERAWDYVTRNESDFRSLRYVGVIA